MILLLLDQTVARFASSPARYQGYPLPPYPQTLTAEQDGWLADMDVPLDQRRNPIFLVDPELGWTNRPDQVSTNHLVESTNSKGYRGRREYAPEPAAGVTRFACFGDSFTWGADVNDDETYPAAMERLDPEVEALNLGVSAYGTDQALMRFRREGKDLGADVVLIGIMVENIGRNVNRYRPLWAPYSTVCCVKPRFVLAGDELEEIPSPVRDFAELARVVRDGSVADLVSEHEYWLDRPALGPVSWSPGARLVGSLLAQRSRSLRRLWNDRDGEPFRVTLAILETFHREALAAGAREAPVVVFPTRESSHEVEEGQVRLWQSLDDELTARGVPVIDVTDAILDEHDRLTAGGDRAPMFTRRNHLTPRYNEVVARTILEWTRSR